MRTAWAAALLALPLLVATGHGARAAGERIRVPRTGVSLVPPPSFQVSDRFLGLESKDGSQTIRVEQYDESFLSFQRRVTSRDLLKHGIMWVESKKVDVQGRDAAMVHVKEYVGNSLHDAWMLVVGSDARTVMLTGSIPALSPPEVAAEMKRALLSVHWNENATTDVFDGLHFRIEEPDGLRIVGRTINAVMLAAPGASKPGDARLAISTSRAEGDADDLEALARANLAASARVTSDPKSVKGRSLVVSDMRGYELTARGEDAETHTPLALYQAIFRRGDRLYALEGVVAADRPGGLDQFRAVAKSLRPTD